MIDPGHRRLSIVRQCELASISRSSFYREPTAENEETLRLMRLIDEQFLETPWYGSRQMARHLRRNGWCVGRHRVRRLMLKMGLAPIYQRPKTSEPHPQHRIWPYLLRHLTIDRPNQVWCADVTYIPMRRGFLYLVAIMDWFSRKVLSWRLSNTMDADFWVTALEEAIACFGKPEIFNTDPAASTALKRKPTSTPTFPRRRPSRLFTRGSRTTRNGQCIRCRARTSFRWKCPTSLPSFCYGRLRKPRAPVNTKVAKGALFTFCP